MRNRVPLLLMLLMVVAAACVVRWREPHLDVMLETDEADYVRASSYGAWSNYAGAHERSGAVFAWEVFNEYRQTGSSHAYAREWEADDASALRHYHPPLAFYPVAMLAGAGVRDERTMRAVPLIMGVLASVASALLAWVLLAGSGSTVRLLFSAVAGMATAASSYHALASTTIAPHAAFSLVATLTLAALTRAVQTGSIRWWLAASALLGVTVLTLPYWTLLVVAAFWVWMWGLGSGRRSFRLFALGVGALLIAMTLVWPPAVLTLGMAKPVLLYLSIALHPPDVGRAVGDWMPGFVRANATISALMLIGAAGLLAASREQRRAAVPTLLFTLGFVLLNLRVSYMKPLYGADVIPAAAAFGSAFTGWAAMKLPSRLRVIPAVGVLVLLVISVLRVPVAPPPSAQWRSALMSLDSRFAGQRVLVTPRQAGSMVKYYLTRARVVLDSDDAADVQALRTQLGSGEINAVLGWGGGVDRNGAAVDVADSGPPSGRTVVDATTVSWWLTR